MGGFTKGLTNWVKGVAELDLERAGRGMFQTWSLGTVNLTSKYNKQKTASGAVAADLENEKKSNSSKRKALYGTLGGVLGQEVQEVAKDYRGNIFGN
jgi:hypothetical protein